MKSKITPNAISSRVSAAGRTRSNSPAGQQLDLFGPEAVPASPSRRRARVSAPPMSATSGQSSSVSSRSAALTKSLASRCQKLSAKVGSMEYVQTWKPRATPAGLLYWEHTARARQTSDSDYTGWPTPMFMDGSKACNRYRPDFQNGLGAVASLTGWPTPIASAGGPTKNPNPRGVHAGNPLATTAQLAGWPTPIASNGNNAYGRASSEFSDLGSTAQLTGWPTPAARDYKGGYSGGRMRDGKLSLDTLDVAAQIAGRTSMSSPVPMESRGGLNPALSRWLVGYPLVWCQAAILAFRTMRTARRKRG